MTRFDILPLRLNWARDIVEMSQNLLRQWRLYRLLQQSGWPHIRSVSEIVEVLCASRRYFYEQNRCRRSLRRLSNGLKLDLSVLHGR